MEEVYLVKPDLSMEKEISLFRREFLDSKEEKMPGCSDLEKFSSASEWIEHTQKISSESTLPEGSVLSDQYVYFRKKDSKIVGMIVFRKITEGDYLDLKGHIGYSVRPSERRKGYAKRMLEDILPECRKLNFKKIYINCNKNNEGSKRVIKSCGGKLEKTDYYPSIDTYEEKYILNL